MTTTDQPIDIAPAYLEMVRDILDEHVPGCEVRAFGSRATWVAKDYSDLDLAVVGDQPIKWRVLGRLKDAFEESTLPFRVDVLDWHDISDNFREIIRGDCTVIKMGNPLSEPTLKKWPTKHLGECATLIRASIDPSSVGDIPYIGLEHIGEGTLSLLNHGVASDVTSTKTLFKQGDILFGKLRPYFRKVIRAPFDGICSTDIWTVRAKEGIDQGYLYYCMASQPFVDFATSGSIGTRMPRAKWEYVSQYSLPVPTLSEQREIAHILESLDNKIELNRRMNETLEAMAHALFKSWFVDFDPVRAKMEGRWQPGESLPGLPAHLYDLFPDRLIPSELGEIPEGWKVGQFGDAAEQVRDTILPLDSPNTPYKHFSIPSFDSAKYPTIEIGSTIRSQKVCVYQGVVLLSKLNPEIERVWLVDVGEFDEAVCSTEFLVLRPQLPFGRYILYCMSCSEIFRQKLEGLATGTSKSHQRASVDSIFKLIIILPPMHTIIQFEQIVSSILNKVQINSTEMPDNAAMRDFFLPKLMSSKWGKDDYQN